MESNKTIKLTDGRCLSYFQFGDPKGKPIFYFHGSGISSGTYAKILGNHASKNGICLIAPDRPGIGFSDFKKDRKLLDWPGDMEELADNLGISQFSIVSESGGSAYSYACACLIPHRVLKAAIVSGLYPPGIRSLYKSTPLKTRLITGIMRKVPQGLLKKMYMGLANSVQKDPETFFNKAAKRSSGQERKMILDSKFQECYKDSITNVFRQGHNGLVQDIRILFSHSWGIDLKDIKCPVWLWHGEKDSSVPTSTVKALVPIIRNCNASFYPDDGHMSCLQLHADEIFSWLAE